MIVSRIGRWKKQIICIAGGFAIWGAAVYGETADNSLGQGYLERGGYGEDNRHYEIVAEGIGEEPISCIVEISPVQYSAEEAAEIMETLSLELPRMILGENRSLDQVRTDLNLPDSFEGTGIWCVWQSRDPEIIDSYGKITAEKIGEEGVQAVLGVTLTDGNHRKEGEIEIRVCPVLLSDDEKASSQLRELIQNADQQNPDNRKVMLPRDYNGKTVRYREARSSEYWILPFLGIALAVLLYGREKSREEEAKKKRKQMLALDYADVVYQLMVYIGAGLTVRKAWECIVENYERRREAEGMHARPAYEEMALTLNRIRCGEPEGAAIEAFGRRCQVQSYMKLASLLEQNRRTGTKNLKQLLEQEMITAWEEQKHTARRMGEEAGTRLLVPLFLMLAVVMVIIMVPALMAVQ